MAILFDWYENPKRKDEQGEELTLHPRIKLNGSTTTAELRRHIQQYCSLTETDVSAVLDALSHFVGRELGEGRQVHLDGIGYFCPTLTCTGPVTMETKRKSTKVKLKGIHFRPDKALRSEIGNIKVSPLRIRVPGRKMPTAEEIDRRLEKHFAANDFLTRSDFQTLCGMTRTTALRHIRRLCEEGKLENRGMLRQPIYYLKKKQDVD
ncbi:HU family DNA-binding protein [Bacteroides sp.]|uniref:HU family DNA-binding protein n=1 Tax=Bacteroides sp. TaxID=29523 RepID=UPI003AB11645